MPNKDNQQHELTVYFDGSCPLCSREIAWYKKQTGAENIDWNDISDKAQLQLEDDLHHEDAMRRFHVRKSDGTLISGASAFSELWRSLPKFKLLGSFVSLPVVSSMAELMYRLFLKVRPLMQRAC